MPAPTSLSLPFSPFDQARQGICQQPQKKWRNFFKVAWGPMKTHRILYLLTLIAAALIGHVSARPGDALRPISGIDAAGPITSANVRVACQAEADEDLNKFGKNKIATGPISWSLLRSISVITPVDSWAEMELAELGFLQSFKEVFTDAYSVRDLMKWMVWGVVSVCVGAAWLLVCIFLILPLLWCRCCRKFMCKDVDLRGRTSRVCNHIAFWTCWILAVAFTVGLVYYSAWIRPDLRAATCLPVKTGGDLLVGSVSKGGYTFDGVAESQPIVTEVQNAVTNAHGHISAANVYDLRPGLESALVQMWQPATTFSSAWSLIDFSDANNTNVFQRSNASELFWLQIYGNVPWLQNPPATAGAYDNLVNPSETAFVYSNALNGLNLQMDADPSVVSELDEIANGSIFGPNFHTELSDSFVSFYNSLLDVVRTVFNKKDGREVWAYALLLVFALLPVIGIIAALMLFVNYFRTGYNFKEQSLSRQRRFAGFMTFGYAFWGIVLFIGGGALLGATYFPSDACRVIDRVLDGNLLSEYESVMGSGVSQDIVDKCLRRDASGDIFESWTETRWSAIDQLIDGSAQNIYNLIHPVDWNLLVSGVDSAAPNVIVPILPSTVFNPDLFLTGLEYEEVPLDNAITSALSGSNSHWQDWFGPAGHVGFRGIRNLQEILANNRLECAFCVHPYCLDGEIMLSPESLHLPDWQSYYPMLSPQNKAGLLSLLTTNAGAVINPILQDAIAVCGPEDSTPQSEFTQWWESFYVLLYRGAALYEKWSAQKILARLNDLENKPLFSRLFTQQDPTLGSLSVTYSEWRDSFTTDFQAALQFHDSINIDTSLASSASGNSELGHLRSQYQNAMQRYDCRAVSLSVEEIKDSLCDSLSGDIASIATFSVWLAVLHFIAFAMCMAYWLARRRLNDKLQEQGEDDKESEAKPRPVYMKDGVTEAQFFHVCEVGDAPTAKKAATQYPPNSVIDLNYNNTPLHVAAYYGHADITQELCEKGWNPNAMNFKRHTPFTACVSNTYLESGVKLKVMTILKNYGALIDIYTGEGDTPLMIATRANEPATVALLLQWNANPLKRDEEYEWSSLKLARSANNQEVLNLLREASPRHKGSPARAGDM
eukprot:Gregarina_sp_Poly_1__6301@NODE_334_length_9463_cov_309_523840_g282_i0_p1_GENE_NODE_334_length_9463_cov_309_523840_g282_i0NODE_334_length_9463_cov_309_523840_g282_i0_p1_ORF_typecomplete_len1114_score125_96Ank_5/PF13857_6/6_5e10Ank_5/PF13857_6/3e06Ank_2/PF12796_7/4_3e08Ank_2/PF12796_7/7e07Ank_4/PF13637_6/1_4e07Ank_4/PF13637_6/0_01Ank_4/PF13637_6/0_01Ank/PF00023_30/7_5e07Ank/PF00023_30/0_0017Ank_3/PF13606_6/5_6e06Ank_3/PF13606_6/0_02Tweety/PF04906_13/0_013Tweety/PF04906_13/9_4e02Tweety/PF04906_13/0